MFFLLSPTPWPAGECNLSLVVCFGAPKLLLEYGSLFGCNIGLDFHLGSTRNRGLNVGRCFIDATCTRVQKRRIVWLYSILLFEGLYNVMFYFCFI